MALIFVTGASTGLGLATAEALATEGHDVVVHARGPDRFDDPSIPERMHGVVYGDLSRPYGTMDVASRASAFGHFDAVIHNAGTTDADRTWSVNVDAPFTMAVVMPRPSRIIVVSSAVHRSGSSHANDGRLPIGPVAYNTSKLYVTAFTMALARRWPDVMAHALCPGWVPTRMGGPHAPDDLAEGHRTQRWLATADEREIEPRTGGFWFHMEPSEMHPAATDPDFQDAVVRSLEWYTGMRLPA